MISPESELLARLEKMEQALAALSIQNGTLRSENARLEAENRLLRARIDKLVRRIFGRSSEKISPEQLELLLQFPEDSVPGAGAKRDRQPEAARRASGEVLSVATGCLREVVRMG